MRFHLLLLFALTVVLLSRTANATIAVPVTVSTVSRSTPNVYDVTVDGNGNVLYVSYDYNSVYRLAANGSAHLLAGSGSSATGATDGVGTTAMFYYPIGMTCDTARNIAYISDTYNRLVRPIVLATKNVTTLAGQTIGHNDGVGAAAQFYGPNGIVYHPSGLLYVADYIKYPNSAYDGYIRKIVIASANVTTVTFVSGNAVYSLCINRAATFLYATTNNLVLRVNVSSGVAAPLAGSTPGFADGVGPNARFNTPQGIALNSDESALIIADYVNQRIRKGDIATSNVTTIAGSLSSGTNDGPGLSATFSYPYGAKWHCNVSIAACGVLVADLNSGSIRFIAIEGPTATAALSEEATRTSSESRAETLSSSLMPTSSITSSISHSSTFVGTTSDTGTATRSVSTTMSSTIGPSASHSVVATVSNATVAVTFSLSLSLTVTLSVTFSPTSLSVSAPTLSSLQSLSHSRSRSGASKSPSSTRRTTSLSASTYCVLVPADGGTSVGNLQPVEASTMSSGVIPLSTLAPATGVASLSRAALLRNVPFGANLSLSLGGTIRGGPVDGWGLVGAALDVLPAGSLFPLLTAVVPFTLMSTDVVGQKQSLVLLLRPPNATTPARWLPTSLNTFRDVTLVFHLSLRCATDRSVTTVVNLRVPCPGEVLPLAAEVSAAASVAQYSTLFSGPPSGGAIGRVAAVRSLVLCSDSGVIEGLLSLNVGACGEGNAHFTVASDARGGILGNLVLWTVACVLMALAVAAYAHVGRTSLRVAAEALGVPSPLLPLVVVTVPSIVSSAFYLLHVPACGADDVVAAVGVVMCVGPIVMLCFVAHAVPRRLTLARHDQHVSVAHRTERRGLRLVSLLFRRRMRWCDADMNAQATQLTVSAKGLTTPSAEPDSTKPLDNAARTWLRTATVLLLEFASLWYACVDLLVLTASSGLGALGMLGSSSVCRGGALAILVLYVAQTGLCAAVRPFTTLFSYVYALFTLTLSSIVVACQVWYLYGSAAYNADLDDLSRLLTAAAVCDLLVSGVSMLKTLVDLVDAGRACWRHICALFSGPPTAPELCDPYNELCFDSDATLVLTDSLSEDAMIERTEGFDNNDVASPSMIFDDDFDGFLALPIDCDDVDNVDGGIFTAGENAGRDINNDLARMYAGEKK
ncbi:membrane-associated protein, putative [Bodo saltans]|nr:membrane-associated protein, putative [Bodo saltans]|eukprot:CUG86610.1 membrane-associated protein, putative [Bodo saltans]